MKLFWSKVQTRVSDTPYTRAPRREGTLVVPLHTHAGQHRSLPVMCTSDTHARHLTASCSVNCCHDIVNKCYTDRNSPRHMYIKRIFGERPFGNTCCHTHDDRLYIYAMKHQAAFSVFYYISTYLTYIYICSYTYI